MDKQLGLKLTNLREAVPDEYVLEDYPAELLLPLRVLSAPNARGWRPLALIRTHHNYERLKGRGVVDVVFHHLDSGVMIVSPSLSSGLRWRVIFPGDAMLCTPSYHAVQELLSVRYEVTLPDMAWLRGVLQSETPWFVPPDTDPIAEAE
jgi:hypothetical protein